MLLSVILTLIVIGFLLWALNQYVVMDAKIKQIINLLVVIAVIVWLLRLSGVLALADVPFPRVR